MHSLDRVPAIRRIEIDRADAYAFEITGLVTPADVENLYGLLEGAYALDDRIDLLLRAVDMEGVEWEGVSKDTTKETRSHAHEHIRRCAIVGPSDSLRDIRGFFSPREPVELRTFDADQEDEAWAWIGARPV